MTTPTNDRQTSERERLAYLIENPPGEDDASIYTIGELLDKSAAQLRAAEVEIEKWRMAAAISELEANRLRADEAEIAQLRHERDTSYAVLQTAQKLHKEEMQKVETLNNEIAALRAENEALRTVSMDDACAVASAYANAVVAMHAADDAG